MDDAVELFATALAEHRAGRWARAERTLSELLTAQPGHGGGLHLMGVIRFHGGQAAEAEEFFRRAALSDPANAGFRNGWGAALLALGRCDEAAACFREALTQRPGDPSLLNNLGTALARQKEYADAEAAFRQGLRARPDDPELLTNLGAVLRRLGHLDEAADVCRRAVAARPDLPQAHLNLGNALAGQGRAEEALGSYEEAARLGPRWLQAHLTLAEALLATGRLDGAVAAYRRALELEPENTAAQGALAEALLARGEFTEAAERFGRLAHSRPEDGAACNGLGCARLGLGDLDGAVAAYRAALRVTPDLAMVRCNLGVAYKDQGKLAEAQACYREAVELDPAAPAFGSAHASSCLYDPNAAPTSILAEHRGWAARHAPPAAAFNAWENNPDPERRLRVAYLSPDFRSHAVAYFVLPLLAAHDSAQVEAFCYADVADPDGVTAQTRARAHHWREVYGLPTERLASLIRDDRIDILVELAGHTAGNRLAVLALKPAPVQVGYLGYPATTGLCQIDYRLGDAVTDPPGEPTPYAEELVRLPGAFCCYGPAANAPPVGPLPALRDGRVTFGSLQCLPKLNGAVLDLWCRVLEAVPGSRLLVSRNTLRGEAADRLRREFRRRGAADERVVFHRTEPVDLRHLLAYHEIDVALDVFPWNGHTTTCEALWMGVPVIALRGDRHSARMAASVLTAAGMEDWVADTADDYVCRAAASAGDLPRLACVRAGLRERVRASALCDARAFTNRLEAAYRQMWRRWCDRRVARPAQGGTPGVFEGRDSFPTPVADSGRATQLITG
jgi:predicted O-linked N-acetylglucosamine transferase (SPINDLY family)